MTSSLLHILFCSPPPDQTAKTIFSTALQAIGNTPMIRLDKIAKSAGLQCELCKLLDFIYTIINHVWLKNILF